MMVALLGAALFVTDLVAFKHARAALLVSGEQRLETALGARGDQLTQWFQQIGASVDATAGSVHKLACAVGQGRF